MPTDLRITGLTAITGAATAAGDLLEVVDVSDLTLAATGTNKRITLAEFALAMSAQGVGLTAAQAKTALSAGGSNPITDTGALTVHEPFVVLSGAEADVLRVESSVLRLTGTAELFDGAAVRVSLSDQGGITLNNAGEVTLTSIAPGQFSFLATPGGAAGMDFSGNTLNLTSDAGTGGFPKITFNPDDAGYTVGGIVLADGTQTLRVQLGLDGTGLTLNDAGGVFSGSLGEVGLALGSGTPYAQLAADESWITSPVITLGDIATSTDVEINTDTLAITSTALQTAAAAIAVLGNSPYGQDAYEDPSTITPETLANNQIARGFMAAA